MAFLNDNFLKVTREITDDLLGVLWVEDLIVLGIDEYGGYTTFDGFVKIDFKGIVLFIGEIKFECFNGNP
jgi:hypothetical protein